MKNKVAITECRNYDYTLILDALKLLVRNTDFPDVTGKCVLVKPNILSDAKPERNITTNPLVVKAVFEILKEHGARRIICGDSPGLPGSGFRGEGCGIYSVCRECGAEWVDFSSSPVERRLKCGISVMQTHYVEDADIIFSVSKMKTHQLMGATGAVKNMFGTVPGLNKSPLHLKAPSPSSFSRVILDIYDIHRPEYSIMDAVISMEGAGPANGTLRHTGLLLASSSALALDRAEAVIMGYRWQDIPILREAERREKGCSDLSYTLQRAEDLVIGDFRRVRTERKGLISSLLLPYLMHGRERKLTHTRPCPSFDDEKCRRCLKCISICPAGALTLSNNSITISSDRCIRCYCCHEMCPFSAINVGRS